MSAEHVLPKWLRERQAPAAAYRRSKDVRKSPHILMRYQRDAIDSAAITAQPRGRWVSPLHITVRAVCRQCNNGWMSRLETAARPHLEQLFDGVDCDLDAAACGLLAAWAAKTSAMFEHNDPPTRVMGRSQLQHVRDHLLPPAATSVWAMAVPTTGEWETRLRHDGALIGRPDDIGKQTGSPRMNAGSTFVSSEGLGLLVIYAPPLSEQQRTPSAGLLAGVTRLWPDPTGLSWPRAPLPERQLTSLAGWMVEHIGDGWS